jgi:hypothetical protein
MSTALPTWECSHFQPTKGRAFLFYVVYGRFPEQIAISRSKYRCAGLPPGFDLRKLERSKHGSLPFTDAEYGKVIRDAALFVRMSL